MALKACRECSKDVSTSAVKCPYCGAPSPTSDPKNAQRVAIGCASLFAVAFVGIAIAVGAGSPSNNTQPATSSALDDEFHKVTNGPAKAWLVLPAYMREYVVKSVMTGLMTKIDPDHRVQEDERKLATAQIIQCITDAIAAEPDLEKAPPTRLYIASCFRKSGFPVSDE